MGKLDRLGAIDDAHEALRMSVCRLLDALDGQRLRDAGLALRDLRIAYDDAEETAERARAARFQPFAAREV